MSASASQAKEQNQPVIKRASLDELVHDIQSLSSEYAATKSKGIKGMFSSGEHSDYVSKIASKAATLIKDIDDTTLMLTAQKVSAASLTATINTKIANAYITLVDLMQEQFNSQVNTWADKHSMLKKEGISHATRCNMYCVNHLNEETKKHTSTREIGRILQDAYKTLGNNERLAWVSSMEAPSRSKTPSPTNQQ